MTRQEVQQAHRARQPPLHWRLWFFAILALYCLLVAASVVYGAPQPLPGVALGYPALLHVERAAALLGGLGAVLLVTYRTAQANFPSSLGNVTYSDRSDVKELEVRVADLSRTSHERLAVLEHTTQRNAEIDQLVASQLTIVEARLRTLEQHNPGSGQPYTEQSP